MVFFWLVSTVESPTTTPNPPVITWSPVTSHDARSVSVGFQAIVRHDEDHMSDAAPGDGDNGHGEALRPRRGWGTESIHRRLGGLQCTRTRDPNLPGNGTGFGLGRGLALSSSKAPKKGINCLIQHHPGRVVYRSPADYLLSVSNHHPNWVVLVIRPPSQCSPHPCFTHFPQPPPPWARAVLGSCARSHVGANHVPQGSLRVEGVGGPKTHPRVSQDSAP